MALSKLTFYYQIPIMFCHIINLVTNSVTNLDVTFLVPLYQTVFSLSCNIIMY